MLAGATRKELIDRMEKGDTGSPTFPWRDVFQLFHEALGYWLDADSPDEKEPEPEAKEQAGVKERFVPGESNHQAGDKDQPKKGKGK